MKRLIVNADDFGLTAGVNRGICRGHREGIITSTTLMANARAFEDAIARAAENPKLGVGCHLVLVGGLAVGESAEIGELADGEGRLPKSVGGLIAKITTGRVSQRNIAGELKAQIRKIQKALAAMGRETTHCDSHKHTHTHPVVMGAMAEAMRETGIRKWRKPYESLKNVILGAGNSDRIKDTGQMAGALAAHLTKPLFESLSRRMGLRAPDGFYGFAATGRLDGAGIGKLLAGLPEGTSELMCHPGENDEDLAATGTRLREQRAAELEAVTSGGLRNILRENGIELISYAEMG